MALVITDDKHYKNIANKIREKIGTTETFSSEQMSDGVQGVYNAGYANGYSAGEQGGVEIGKELGRKEGIADGIQQGRLEGKLETHNLWLNKAVTELNEPYVTEIGAYQFYGFTLLERAIFPSVTTSGSYAFRGCNALAEVYFPKLEAIAEQMFYRTMFRIFDAPVATSIANNAFAYNSSLIALILRNEDGVVSLSSINAFTNTKIASGNGGYIYVPRILVETYKGATNWSTYDSRFRVLEDYTVDGTTTGELDESKI